MKNKIELQILTPATREQLIELRDEIRKVDGLEAFNLQLPPAPLTKGKMDGGVGLIILDAVIAGVTHFTAERTADYYQNQIARISRKILGIRKKPVPEQDEAMSGSNMTESEKPETNEWKVILTDNRNGKKSVTSLDESGSSSLYSNREYSIDPENTYAVLIGVSEYDDRANFSPIPPVAGNLDEMYRVLTDKTLVGLPFENVTRLYNESCINIKNELRNVSRTNDIRTLIIYYSGHGQNTGNNQLSLIAKDTSTIDDELHNDIPYAFVEKMINASQADQKIVILDACHSGLAAQGNSNVFDFEPVLGTFTLASTSADDSSYYKREAANTYFTSFLTEAFKKGIPNSHTMLSLTDLYEYTSQKLAKIQLPIPVCKAQFKNIMADKFYISGNPSFSLEARLALPGQLYQQGRYEEARREYMILEKEYPENQQLRNDHIEFERNTEFNRLVKEGDYLFFRERQFRTAKLKYQEALAVKYDENLRDKITDCDNELNAQAKSGQKQEIPSPLVKPDPPEKPRPVYQTEFRPKPTGEPDRKRQLITIRVGVLVIALLTLLYFYLTRQKEESFKDSSGNAYTYTGDTKNGKPEGRGKAKFKNGNEYDGEWTDGKMDGRGTMLWTGGDSYTGYFKNDYLNGTGTIKYQNGNVFDGSWIAGVMQGQVTASFKNGNKFEGSWYNGAENGYGKFTWTNGDVYEGNFKDNNRDGVGTYTASGNDIYYCRGCRKYIGGWKNNLKEGFGRCFDGSDNIIYTGNFHNDMPVNPAYPDR